MVQLEQVLYLDVRNNTKYNNYMDLKVYRKEEVIQPDGTLNVLKPDIIDIYPEMLELVSENQVQNEIWSLDKLQYLADVKIKDGKLIINSDNIIYENGIIYIKITENKLYNAQILEDNSEELLLQECALATIWQRGLDPVEPEDGIRWSQALIGEVNPLQLIEDINNAVENVTNSVIVEVGTVTSINGQEYLSFKLKMTA